MCLQNPDSLICNQDFESTIGINSFEISVDTEKPTNWKFLIYNLNGASM